MIHNKCPPSTTILSLSNISRLLFYYTQSGAFSGVQPLQHPQWMTSASAAQNTHHFKMFQCNNVQNVLQWMTSACTHCSHCFTMFEWHGSLSPTRPQRVLGCYLIKKIYIVRRPSTLKRARTQDAAAWNYSVQSNSKPRAVAHGYWALGIVHWALGIGGNGPRPRPTHWAHAWALGLDLVHNVTKARNADSA